MKLQEQYNRITIISTFFILLIAAASYFFLLRFVLIGQLDESLKVEEAEIYDYVKKYDSLPAPSVYKDQRISFSKTNGAVKREFSNINLYDSIENDSERSRQIVFPVLIKGQYYTASVVNSEEATEDLVWIILLATIGLIILLTLILFFTNRFLIKKLWRPFHQTLSIIKDFNLAAPAEVSLHPTTITEFRELNESIRMMTQKVMRDYQSLKDFTNHASHEIQTPLAVLNSKLDILIQQPELSEKSMLEIQGMYKSIEKVSKLCQSLLLLARIDNNQYTGTQQVDVFEMLAVRKPEIEEWATGLNLHTDFRLSPLTVTMNTELAEILINNLLLNAARHNLPQGIIIVETTPDRLVVSNSGTEPLNKDVIFERFFKSSQSGGSGLGLAIVKKITGQFDFSVNYYFKNNLHCFAVRFHATDSSNAI